jgi:hypothetical protein
MWSSLPRWQQYAVIGFAAGVLTVIVVLLIR